MGSPLCHRYITTDFSEAQLEMITPPLIDKKTGLNFLENIHHFVSKKIEDDCRNTDKCFFLKPSKLGIFDLGEQCINKSKELYLYKKHKKLFSFLAYTILLTY